MQWFKSLLTGFIYLSSVGWAVEVVEFPLIQAGESESSWGQLIASFRIKYPHQHPLLEYWKNNFLTDQHNLKQSFHAMSPYLPWMLEQIAKYNLPGEIVLIPLIESSYRPNAHSSFGALGLWQINRITATHYGLKENYHYQPRFDPICSTQVALAYLNTLYKEFKSWPLVFAAYNAGPKRVRDALQKINYRYESDFFELDLPEQTKHYVPKLLALADILQHYQYYGMYLIECHDPLQPLLIKEGVDFSHVSLALNIPAKILKQYNPSYELYRSSVHTAQHLLIPQSYQPLRLDEFHARLTAFQKAPFYSLPSGQTWESIAKLVDLKIEHFKDANPEYHEILKEPTLRIPKLCVSLNKTIEYKVKPGDTLFQLARNFDTTIEMLKIVNQLPSSVIRVNQMLLIPQGRHNLAK